jgi:hypothetical protein
MNDSSVDDRIEVPAALSDDSFSKLLLKTPLGAPSPVQK